LNSVLFRVDANKEIGLGHYKRCLAISHKLNADAKCIFLTKTKEIVSLNNNSATIKINKNFDFNQEISFTNDIIDLYEVDVIICDINNKIASKNKNEYLFYLEKISEMKPLLVSFEDFEIHDTNSDLIVIPYVGSNKINIDERKKTKYLLGPKYFIIRNEFLRFRKKRNNNNIRNILISLGGSDPKNITDKIIYSISGIAENIHLNIIKGPLNNFGSDFCKKILKKSKISFNIYESPPNISELMEISDLAIIGSGLTQYEASAVGLPAIVISLNKYHKKIVDQYAKMNSIISFGTFNSRSVEKLKEIIIDTMNNKTMIEKMSINGKKIIDGKGIARLMNKINSKLGEMNSK